MATISLYRIFCKIWTFAILDNCYTGLPWIVTDDDRRRQTPATVISLAPTPCVGGPIINK